MLWRTCLPCLLLALTAQGTADRVAGVVVCPSWRQFQAELLGALSAPGLSATLSRWRPLVLKNALRSSAALIQELMDSDDWQRTSSQAPEERNHTVSRASLKRMAKAADLLDLGNLTEDDLVNVSCIGKPQNGRPWRSHWGKLNDGGTPSGLNDRVMLQKPAGWGNWDKDKSSSPIFNKHMRPMEGPDFQRYHLFGPAPNHPCLAKLTRALASQEVISKLQDALATRVPLVPFLMRIYKHKRWHHYTQPHTDQMFSGLGKQETWEPLQSMISVNLNLGGDEVPGHGNGGLVWCATGIPRWIPAPRNSAIIFRVSNHSWHAVLPGHRAPTGVRLTLQIVYAAKLRMSGTSQAMGYDLEQRFPEIFEGGEPSIIGSLDPSEDEGHEGCHDMDPITGYNCAAMFEAATDREIRVGCDGGLLLTACCGSCQMFLALRREMLLSMHPRQLEVAGFLAAFNPQFSRRLSSGHLMPLLAFGTGGLSGQRASDIIAYALQSGYRHLDSAASYPSHPDALHSGVLRSGIPRNEIFLSTKVPPSTMGFEATRALMLRLREELPGNYADLCLVHWPSSEVPPPESVDTNLWMALERVGTWKALEMAYDMGICKSIGVSNYLKKHLEELMKYARVRPSVNQLEYTPMAPLLEELAFCEDHDIAISAFGWNEAFVLNQEELNVLAETLLPDAEFSRELLMKVLMRWYMAQGMVPLFRSSREEVLLDLAESLAISMPEEAIGFLRQPISEYPWQYYSGERPWNAAVITSVETVG